MDQGRGLEVTKGVVGIDASEKRLWLIVGHKLPVGEETGMGFDTRITFVGCEVEGVDLPIMDVLLE